jgi:hypothetical protein
MNDKLLWSLFGLLSLALGAAALYKAWPLLYPSLERIAPVDPHCNLRAGPCVTTLEGGGRVRFGIEPRTIPLLEPLALQVQVEGLVPRQVVVDFSGVDMYMGFNRVTLVAEGAGRYGGTSRIPVCTREAMEWEAKVLLHDDHGIVAVPFRFITVKPGAKLPD